MITSTYVDQRVENCNVLILSSSTFKCLHIADYIQKNNTTSSERFNIIGEVNIYLAFKVGQLFRPFSHIIKAPNLYCMYMNVCISIYIHRLNNSPEDSKC